MKLNKEYKTKKTFTHKMSDALKNKLLETLNPINDQFTFNTMEMDKAGLDSHLIDILEYKDKENSFRWFTLKNLFELIPEFKAELELIALKKRVFDWEYRAEFLMNIAFDRNYSKSVICELENLSYEMYWINK